MAVLINPPSNSVGKLGRRIFWPKTLGVASTPLEYLTQLGLPLQQLSDGRIFVPCLYKRSMQLQLNHLAFLFRASLLRPVRPFDPSLLELASVEDR